MNPEGVFTQPSRNLHPKHWTGPFSTYLQVLELLLHDGDPSRRLQEIRFATMTTRQRDQIESGA